MRLSRGITQGQLAENIGVTATQISDIEHGKSLPSLKRAGAIAEYFGVSLDSLVRVDAMSEDDFSPTKEEMLLLVKLRNMQTKDREFVEQLVDRFLNND